MDPQVQIMADKVTSLEMKSLVKSCLKIMITTMQMITLCTILSLTKETYQCLFSLIPPQRTHNPKTSPTKLRIGKVPPAKQKKECSFYWFSAASTYTQKGQEVIFFFRQ